MEYKKITEDGGIGKCIITEGTGDYPPAGCKVQCHYVGTFLDGREFDSSRRKNRVFEFPLGAGRVIKGWDVGIASMKKGEKCSLKCGPEYAYGRDGAGGVIPPNATLLFEVELLGWN